MATPIEEASSLALTTAPVIVFSDKQLVIVIDVVKITKSIKYE